MNQDVHFEFKMIWILISPFIKCDCLIKSENYIQSGSNPLYKYIILSLELQSLPEKLLLTKKQVWALSSKSNCNYRYCFIIFKLLSIQQSNII